MSGSWRFLSFLFFLMLPTLASASAVCTPSNILPDWTSLMLLGVLITVFFIALIYMFGKLTGNNRLIFWARSEIYQLFFSALIVGLAQAVMQMMCSQASVITEFNVAGISTALVNVGITNADSYHSVAEKYLLFLIKKSDEGYLQILNKIGEMEKEAAKVKWYCVLSLCIIGSGGYSESPNTGYHTVIGTYTMFLNIVMVSLLDSIFMYFILQYIGFGFYSTLFPFGMILRSMPFMRRFGGSLIALAISMFILYPFMLVVDALVFLPIAIPLLSSINPTAKPFEYAALMSVGTVFLPAVNFIILVAFTRELSSLIGEEMDINRLAQMV